MGTRYKEMMVQTECDLRRKGSQKVNSMWMSVEPSNVSMHRRSKGVQQGEYLRSGDGFQEATQIQRNW